jgi:hypothetical protein
VKQCLVTNGNKALSCEQVNIEENNQAIRYAPVWSPTNGNDAFNVLKIVPIDLLIVPLVGERIEINA